MNIFKKRNAQNYLLPPEKEEKIKNLLDSAPRLLWPHPNDDVEFIIPLFNAEKHYKHLKKIIWKNSRR